MDKRNIITLTLFLSALVFTPLVAQEGEFQLYTVTQQKPKRVSADIAATLHQKGLDADAALRIANDFVAHDDVRFSLMMENLLASCQTLTREEVLAYLSEEALHRQKVELYTYGQLVSMVTKVKKKTPDETVLNQLSSIAKHNQRLCLS